MGKEKDMEERWETGEGAGGEGRERGKVTIGSIIHNFLRTH